MSYKIEVTSHYLRQARRLVKKYPSLKPELAALFDSLQSRPQQGSPLGNNCYKIRLSISSKGKGKSGGARIITHLFVLRSTVYILSIYDKSELSSLSDKEVKELLKLIP